jgi:hypothetical protein
MADLTPTWLRSEPFNVPPRPGSKNIRRVQPRQVTAQLAIACQRGLITQLGRSRF